MWGKGEEEVGGASRDQGAGDPQDMRDQETLGPHLHRTGLGTPVLQV